MLILNGSQFLEKLVNNKFLLVLVVLIMGFFGLFFFKKKDIPKEILVGTSHEIQGREHIAQGQPHDKYSTNLPSSGPHYASSSSPAPWGVYTQEVPDEVFIHNEEHGGVIIAYKPGTDPEVVKKIQKLFAPPYSNKKFTPSKALVTPRSKNIKTIQLAGWGWTLDMDEFNEEVIIKFYLQRVGKGPEGSAGPSNTPINQAESAKSAP